MKLFDAFFLAFILGEIFLTQVEANYGSSHHKKATTTRVVPTTTTTMPICNYTKCEAQSTQFCLCNYPNHSIHWHVPKDESCASIGCMLAGQQCYCGINGKCRCTNYLCNKTECAAQTLQSGCYCYFGNSILTTDNQPASNRCSDLLNEIGNRNGLYQCSSLSCGCDQFGECVCEPPKHINPPEPLPIHCDQSSCTNSSFEFCECDYSDCSGNKCINNVVFKKLPSNGICSGILKNSSYQCRNVGQRCYCHSRFDSGLCTCVPVDPFGPYLSDCKASTDCGSYVDCICAYEEFQIRINNGPKNCSALTNLPPHSRKSSSKFYSCPYRIGQDCTCERNPNTGKKQCFCRDANPFMNRRFARRPQLGRPCSVNSECLAQTELYCYCTNHVNGSKVENITSSALANLRDSYESVEKLCYVYGKPPDLSCHPFGYKASCREGFCRVTPVNLFFNNRDDADD